ncbi:MAG: AAA family ATPase [Pseudomonadota bacterium]
MKTNQRNCMYLEHFGLREAPFLLTPDSDFLYLSPQHAKAKAYMDYTLINRDSFVVITGEIGCGKTTLINKLISEINRSVVLARIFQTQVSPVQFLQAVLVQFGFKPFGKRKAELLDMLNKFLREQHRKRKQVVLIVDEAQNLSLRVLEEIRLLSDVETQKDKILNVILVGQPQLQDKLETASLEQLAQRTRFRLHLTEFDEDNTRQYVAHRLGVAGYEGDSLFDDEALGAVFQYSGGVPRLINTLADTALTAAYADGEAGVTAEMVATAADELGWREYVRREERTPEPVASEQHQHMEWPKFMLSLDGYLVGEVPLDSRRLMVGRDVDNEITVISEFVSRHHAQILVQDDGVWVKDLNSTNGTFVNGKRIRSVKLNDGDIMAVGRHRLVFVHPQPATDSDSGQEVADLDDWRETTVLDENDLKAFARK